MITCGNCSDIIWEISIIKESPEGLLCMDPNGETQFLTHTEYEIYLKNRKERHENGNLYIDTKS